MCPDVLLFCFVFVYVLKGLVQFRMDRTTFTVNFSEKGNYQHGSDSLKILSATLRKGIVFRKPRSFKCEVNSIFRRSFIAFSSSERKRSWIASSMFSRFVSQDIDFVVKSSMDNPPVLVVYANSMIHKGFLFLFSLSKFYYFLIVYKILYTLHRKQLLHNG